MISRPYAATLISCFLLCGLIAAVGMPCIHALVKARAASAETADFAAFLFLIAFTGSALLYASTGASKAAALPFRSHFWLGLFLLVFLLFAAAVVTPLPSLEQMFWFGYGQSIILLAAAFIPIVIVLVSSERRGMHLALAIITYAGLVLVYLPSIVQPPWSLMNMDHSRYVVNELLAPQLGGYPLVNFTAQYTSILGYVFNLLWGSKGSADQAIWFLTILAVIVVAMTLAPLIEAFPPRKHYLAALFTIPAIFVVNIQGDDYVGSMAALFASLPVRLLFPSLVVLLLAIGAERNATLGKNIVLALVGALSILNNIESGVVTTLATLMVLTFTSNPTLRLYQATRFVALVAVAFGLYALLIDVAYGRLDLERLTAFVGGFGAGFGAVPMPTFGLWVFTFAFLSMGLVVATLHFGMRHPPLEEPNAGRLARLGEILMFWSAFGIGMAPYYINRSVVSGQLQFILYPAFFATAALLLLVWPYTRGMRRNMALVVAALPPAIALASTTSYPSIVPSYKRLTHVGAPFSAGYAGAAQQIQQTIDQIKAHTGFRQFGLYADFGFIYAQHLHIPSYLPVNYPLDLTVIDPSIGSSTCALLRQDRNEILVTSERLDEPAMKLIAACGYVVADDLTVPGSGLTLLKRQ